MSLYELGIKHGSGKSGHNYLSIYENYLGAIRTSVRSLLEIGIDSGGSLRMWEDFFPNATIIGLDKHQHNITQFRRAKAVLADVGHICQLLSAVEGHTFDVIVDDGSHWYQHQIGSFEALWPLLNVGGLYFIEDLVTSYRSGFGGPPTAIEYLKSLVDVLNYGGRMETSGQLTDGEIAGMSMMERTIQSIHFYPYLVVIKKWAIEQANA